MTNQQIDLQQIAKIGRMLQQKSKTAQVELDQSVVTGVGGAGLVTVRLSGTGRFKGIQIDPAVFTEAQVGDLEGYIAEAIHDAGEKATRLAEKTLGVIAEIGIH